jgi:hypothetical protein
MLRSNRPSYVHHIHRTDWQSLARLAHLRSAGVLNAVSLLQED